MERFEIIKVARDIQQPTERTYLLESQVGKPVVQGSDANKKSILRFLAALSIGVVVHFALAAIAIRVVDVDVDVDVPIRSKINQESNKPGEISSNGPTSDQAKYVPFRFEEKLQPFSKNILAGYSSCEDLIQDVQHALESLANDIIESQRNDVCVWDPNGPIKEFQPEDSCEYVEDKTNEFEYRSRIQMDGVDQAELIKSNGNYVFMGHGREVVVLDSNGTVVDRVEVPPPPSDTQAFFVDKDRKSSSTAHKVFWPCGPPKPRHRRILSLLMHEDKTTGVIMLNVMTIVQYPKITSSFLTTALIYKFAGSKLKLVASKDINGTYRGALAIGRINHIVTYAPIQTWRFEAPLFRCIQSYWNTTNEQYEQIAFAKAYETVASFAKDIAMEIVNGFLLASNNFSGNECKHIAQISSMTTGDEHVTWEKKRYGIFYGKHHVLRSFVHLSSIDLGSVTPAINSDDLGKIDANVAGAFLANERPDFYVYAKDLIVIDRGGRYDDNYIYLLKFDLSNGVMAVPKAVGEVPGYLYWNEYSMNINMYKDLLRVVTANHKRSMVVDNYTGQPSWNVEFDDPSYQVVILQDNGDGELTKMSLIGIPFRVSYPDSNHIYLIRDRGYVMLEDRHGPAYSFDLAIPIEPKRMAALYEFETDLSRSSFLILGGKGMQVGDFMLTWSSVYPDDYVSGMRVGRPGTKIAVLDIRDIANAYEVANYMINDHFLNFALYLEESSKLILPFCVNVKTTSSTGFIVLNIDIPNQKICITEMVTHSDYGCIWADPTIPLGSLRSMASQDYIALTMRNINMLKDVNNLIRDVWTQVNLDANCSEHD